MWIGSGYNKESLENLDDALKTMGPVRAKDLMTQVQGGLAALGTLQCTTPMCENIKFELLDRSFKALDSLDEVYGFGAIVIGGIAGMAGAGGSRPGAGAVPGASSNVNKAYEYWAAVKAERVAGAKEAGTALGNAERGVLTEANFAQNRIKSDRSFSPDGQRVYSDLTGKPIRTVDDLADAFKTGTIKPSQLPVDYVDMNGIRLILNTRTYTALEQAGIPRSQWFGRNQTGVEAYPGKIFNDLAAGQLKNNKLPPTGAERLKSVRP